MDNDPTKIVMNLDPRLKRLTGTAKHGHTPFDVPYITEITPNLWQGGCMNGLLLPLDVKHMVSLYPWEQYAVGHALDSVLSVRMYDSEEQQFQHVVAIANYVNECRKDGITLVHCQAGLNRSSLVVAFCLMLDGMSPEEAIALIREKRSPACLCNKSFESWLLANG